MLYLSILGIKALLHCFSTNRKTLCLFHNNLASKLIHSRLLYFYGFNWLSFFQSSLFLTKLHLQHTTLNSQCFYNVFGNFYIISLNHTKLFVTDRSLISLTWFAQIFIIELRSFVKNPSICPC